MRLHATIFILALLFLPVILGGCGKAHPGGSTPSLDDDTILSDDDAAADDDNDAADDDDNDDNDDNDDSSPSLPAKGTRNPIVLMHGFFGWGDVGSLSYFAGVQADLTAQGYDVYEPAVSPINSMEDRAAAWAKDIDAHFGAGTKVNMIAHSQGGLDARYMISTMHWGDRVGALVMVSTPNRGTVLADIATGLIPGIAQDVINWILNLLGMSMEGITELSHAYVENVFNPANPDDPRVGYYSFQVNAATNCFFLLQPTHLIIETFDGANDGVVDDTSANWGVHLGLESADHWSIIGQPVGLANFDQIDFYRGIAKFLRDNDY